MNVVSLDMILFWKALCGHIDTFDAREMRRDARFWRLVIIPKQKDLIFAGCLLLYTSLFVNTRSMVVIGLG
jgi:hypothetical protein